MNNDRIVDYKYIETIFQNQTLPGEEKNSLLVCKNRFQKKYTIVSEFKMLFIY